MVLAANAVYPSRRRYTLISLRSGASSSTIRISHEGWLMSPNCYYRPMKFYTEYLTFKTAQHREYVNITSHVETALRKSGIREAMILVSAMHITAGVWVNDAEDGLIADIDEWLEGLAPFREDYRHHRTGETNGDSHLKSLLVHHQVIVPVTNGKLDFGPWQQVYYAEFDGRRAKRVVLKVMGE
ncbi:MAG TPA: secondary thiamine-phosphate synthase enzyme YjbQ [Bryobacteraceae bacterium]